MRPAIFLDRDGVINEDKHYVSRIADFEFIDGVVPSLRTLAARGFPLIVVTNQSAIGRGYATEQNVAELHSWMLAELANRGVPITAVYHCPHHPDDGCACRKPAPGMIERAAREHEIDLGRSWMIGDRWRDIEAAHRAGVHRAILIRSPREPHPDTRQIKYSQPPQALFVCNSIFDTVRILTDFPIAESDTVQQAETDLNDKTVLITGAAGFIGANLAHAIQQRYPRCRIVGFDAFVLGHFKNLRGFRGECIAGDISRPDDLAQLNGFRFDAIFHQAAISDTTVTDQQQVVRVNTNAFGNILELAVKHRTPVVYASSAGVYGNSPPPHRVGEGEAPENVYGFSKLMMDHLAGQYVRRHDFPIVGLRYFNVYGPRESYKGTTASMMLQLARQMLAGERPKLFKHGEQRRDFVYVDDVVQANLKALAPRVSGVYNVGSGNARTFNDVLKRLVNGLGIDVKPEYVDNPWSFYQHHTEADIAPTREMLGYEPRYSLEQGIDAYLPEILRICQQEVQRDAA